MKDRQDARAFLSGVGLLGATAILLELFTFRVCAAAISHGFAVFVAIVAPAAAGLAAMVLGRKRRSREELARDAAHLAMLAGVTVVLGAVGITWMSQKVFSGKDTSHVLQTAVGLASCLLPAFFAGGALGIAMRVGAATIGRLGYVEGAAAAAACLTIPLWLSTLGAPRAWIAMALLLGGAAILLAQAGRSAEPRWSLIYTLPLVVAALIAGDYGEPWLEVRIETARRTTVDHAAWTSQGLIAVTNVQSGKASVAVDRNSSVPLGKLEPRNRKPTFALQDLLYAMGGNNRGPVLVIGSGAGREIAVGLAYEHPRLDAIELHGTLVNDLLLRRYADLTNNLLVDHGRVAVHVGDGRAELNELPADYQYIVVMDDGRFDQAMPRLLSRTDRLFTREATRDYLAHLRPDGAVLMRIPSEGLSGAIAGGLDALDAEARATSALACHAKDRSVLVISKAPLSSGARQKLVKRCKQSKGTVEYPLDEIKHGRKDYQALVEQREAKLAAFEKVRPVDDDRPFLAPPEAPAELQRAAVNALASLSPASPAKPKNGEDPDGEPATTPAGLAAAALMVTVLLLGIGLSTQPPGGRARRAPLTLRMSLPLFGVALAAGTFALSDALLRMTGDAEHAWSLIVPLGLAGAGSGRLLADALEPERAPQRRIALFAGGLVWFLLMWAVADGVAAQSGAPGVAKVALLGLATVSGVLLGFPLAAVLRAAAAHDAAQVSWCWGAHLSGWAVGGGLCALLVHYLGVSGLWLVGAGAFALAAALAVLGMRSRPAARPAANPPPQPVSPDPVAAASAGPTA